MRSLCGFAPSRYRELGQERLDAAGFGLHRFYNLKMLLRIRTAEIVELIQAAGPIMPLSVDPVVMRERQKTDLAEKGSAVRRCATAWRRLASPASTRPIPRPIRPTPASPLNLSMRLCLLMCWRFSNHYGPGFLRQLKGSRSARKHSGGGQSEGSEDRRKPGPLEGASQNLLPERKRLA